MIKHIHSFFHRHYHTRYHGKYAHAKQLFIFDLVLLGLAIVMMFTGLYFAFWKPGEIHFARVQVLLGNDRIKSGDDVTVTINYVNTSKFVLLNPTLAVHTPKGFVIDRTKTPTSTLGDNDTIAIDDLVPGARGKVEIHGRLFSEPGKEDEVIGMLTFLPEGLTGRSQEATPFTFKLPESVLRGSLDVTTSTYPGKIIPVAYTLENPSNHTIEHISLETNSSNAIFSSKDMEEFDLAPSATRTFVGNFTVPNKGNKIVLGISPRVSVNGNLIKQSEALKTIEIFNPNVTVTAEFLEPAAYSEVGAKIPLTVKFSNNGSYTISNAEIELLPTNGVVDLNATAKLNNIRTDGAKLIISRKEKTELTSVRPGQKGQINLAAQLLPHFNLGDVENANLEIEPAFVGGVTSVSGQTFRSVAEAVKIPLATEVSLTGQARYYTDDGEQLGRGPLPPRVGQATRYFILFDVYNTTNMISGASFVARLPENVMFTGKQSVTLGPKLTFDSSTRLVRWSYEQVPANSQTGFYFEVAVTPTANQAGQTLLLLEDARFTAKDDVVGKPFSLGKGAITNVLPSEDQGARSGAGVR